MSDPTLILPTDSSEPSDHDHCHGESSSSVGVFQADTAQQNAARWPLVADETVDQKTLAELREESNLDSSFDSTADAGIGEASATKQAETPLQTAQPLAWQDGDAFSLQGSNFFADEQPIAYTRGGNNFWDSQGATTTQQVTAEPLSLRAEPLSESQKEFANDTDSGATAVAVIGIVAVAVSTVAFFIAIVMVRWRSRRNATQCGGNEEYSPLRSTLNTVENTVSLSCRDSFDGAEAKANIEKVEFFG